MFRVSGFGFQVSGLGFSKNLLFRVWAQLWGLGFAVTS